MIRRKKIQLLFCIVNIFYALGSGVSATSGSNETTDNYLGTTDPTMYASTQTAENSTQKFTHSNDYSETTNDSESTDMQTAKYATVETTYAHDAGTTDPTKYTSSQTPEDVTAKSTFAENSETADPSESTRMRTAEYATVKSTNAEDNLETTDPTKYTSIQTSEDATVKSTHADVYSGTTNSSESPRLQTAGYARVNLENDYLDNLPVDYGDYPDDYSGIRNDLESTSMPTLKNTTVESTYAEHYLETTDPTNYLLRINQSEDTSTQTTENTTVESTHRDDHTTTLDFSRNGRQATTESTTSSIETSTDYCRDVPSSVENLRVTNVTHNSIVVSWDSPTSSDECISTYTVAWYSGDQSLGSQTKYANESEIVILELTSCTSFNITVVAHGKYTDSEKVFVSVTTSESDIPAVNNLAVVGIELGLNITWDPPDDVSCLSSYSVVINTVGANDVKSTTDTSYTFTDLAACTKYAVQVTPIGRDSFGVASSESGTTLDSIPGTVIDLAAPSENITESSVYLSWSKPTVNASCVLHYVVTRCNDSECTNDTTTEEFYNATGLDPCVTYDFTVVAVGDAGSSDAEGIAATTSYIRPGIPRNVSATPGQFSIFISWEAPLVGGTCVKSYRVTLWDSSGQTLSTDTTNITISGLVACENYTAAIIPVSTTNADGEIATVVSLTEDSVHDPPTLYIEEPDVTTSTISITWNVDTTLNQCELKNILTNCYFDSTDGNGFETVNGTSEDNISGIDSSNVTITVTIGSLSPYSWYTCVGLTENIAGYSTTSTNVTARTAEDVPSAPNITVSDIASNTFKLVWEKPEYLPGNLTEHEIHLEFDRLFPVPASCNYTDSSNNISDIGGSTFTYDFSNATPYSNYTAKIRARTGAGWGNYSDYLHFVTGADVPGVVNNLTYLNTTNPNDPHLLDTFLFWELPCESNGPIEAFQIYYNGTRNGFEDNVSTYVYNVTESIYADKIFEISLGELQAEYNYTFQVSPKVLGVSQLGPSTSYNVVYPAGIPPRPSQSYMEEIKVNPFDAIRTSSSAYVLLPLFENTNGEIQYYAVMIAEINYNNMSYSRFDTLSGDWPSTQTWQQAMSQTPITRYQATEVRWYPDESNIVNPGHLRAVRFNLGENESCTELTHGEHQTRMYCNGPLRPDTWYQVRMRAFTNGGYRDSLAILAKTEAVFNMGLVVGVVFGILFFGIVTTMTLLVRKGVLQSLVSNFLHPNVSSSPGPEPMTRKKFELHCQELIEHPGKLSNEFQLLQTLSVDLEMSATAAVLQVNRKKNRYINILPYDITRVKLDLLNNEPNTDYINASFIKGYSGVTEYIACQGPKEETTYDFWRMVLQYNVSVIVMVTQLVEKGKDKCHQYYPETREQFEYEDMTIRCSSQLDRVFYKQRTITLQKGKIKRKVMHLHFKEWSDHGVPDDIHSMINFCQLLRRHMIESKSLAVIHCSAGVGRTGTLIALDILLQQIRDNKKLDIFGTVYKLRQHRMNMVQTESQYAYIYNCVKQVVNNPKTYKTPSIEPMYENIPAKNNVITDSNTNLVNSAETLKKISPSPSTESMEPVSENSLPGRPGYTRQLSTLSNGLRYSKSTGAIDTLLLPGVQIVRHGSHEYPIFEPAPDTLSTGGSLDRNSLLEFSTQIRIRDFDRPSKML